MSELEETLLGQLRYLGVPTPEREYRFASPRRWRFDMAWPATDYRLAVEVEGGTWAAGRHVRPLGFRADCLKYNQAAIRGWVVLRYDSSMIESRQAAQEIADWLEVQR